MGKRSLLAGPLRSSRRVTVCALERTVANHPMAALERMTKELESSKTLQARPIRPPVAWSVLTFRNIKPAITIAVPWAARQSPIPLSSSYRGLPAGRVEVDAGGERRDQDSRWSFLSPRGSRQSSRPPWRPCPGRVPAEVSPVGSSEIEPRAIDLFGLVVAACRLRDQRPLVSPGCLENKKNVNAPPGRILTSCSNPTQSLKNSPGFKPEPPPLG